eukprot:7784971-Alexandrium_andersonii.AAC.1
MGQSVPAPPARAVRACWRGKNGDQRGLRDCASVHCGCSNLQSLHLRLAFQGLVVVRARVASRRVRQC